MTNHARLQVNATPSVLATLTAVSEAIAAERKLRYGRLTPEEIERAAQSADIPALVTEVVSSVGEAAARDPWSFFAWGRPRGYVRNLILIYSRACELAGVVPSFDLVGGAE